MELPSEDHKLEEREDGRGRWSLKGKGSETPEGDLALAAVCFSP